MISIKQISKSYQTTKALQNISLDFHEGQCFGLVGPNGAGKSTLIKILVGIVSSDEGNILAKDNSQQNWKNSIGYVPQEICLSETLTAEQNLAFFGGIYHIKGKALKNRIDDILAYVGLQDRKKSKVNTFSGGMKRRLNIGCALIHDPDLILLDEPTVGIDPQSRKFILDLIQELKQANKTVIFSSHYIEEVEVVCDEVAFIDKGNLLLHQQLDDLLQQHATPALYVKWKEDFNLKDYSPALGNVKPYKNGYKIELEELAQAIEHILKLGNQNKLTLESLELIQPSLEEVFFSFTGQELRA